MYSNVVAIGARGPGRFERRGDHRLQVGGQAETTETTIEANPGQTGSDFPHPEGLRDPLAFSEEIDHLPIDVQKAVMGGNLARLLGVG
jgi:hypothetical protein